MTRRIIAVLTLSLGGALIWADLRAAEPLNPYRAPPLLALGSGQAAGGAHCAAPPPPQ